jgi:glycosyltransferase involved in cell wall biosynthesis
MKNKILVSIFIPVYDGEKYLEATLLSVKNQTYKNIEVLLVDDSSTDKSLSIINKFATQDSRFKVYLKENGGMVSTSWNFILPKIQGDFVFYASQDDLFSEDLIEKMVIKQQESNADTVLPDMEFYYENILNNNRIIGLNGNREIVLSGREACVKSLFWNIHGFALSSKKLFEKEFFPEDSFDSDEFMTRKLFFKSNKVVFSQGVFFYRQDNLNAITKTATNKNFYTLNTAKRLFDFLVENNFDKKYTNKVQFELYRRFLMFSALYNLFPFELKEDKNEVKKFLNNFKQKNISSKLLFTNLKSTRGKLGLKFFVLFLVYRTNILYKMAVKIEEIRINSSKNKV